ncbi:MAG: flavin reductase family protein [Bacillota bacterium]|jgi:flavin reductase (DIM6/NTAB) family NADH-FMN oxidoreductase RutF
MPARQAAPKRVLRPGTNLYPLPAVLVSCAAEVGGERRENLITLAWTGIACAEPPMITIAVRKSRFSHGLIAASREFVVNVPSADMSLAVDLCGSISGRDADKFARAALTPSPAGVVRAPLVAECPVSLECRVRHTYEAGSHDLFVGEIVALQAAETVLDADGKIDVALVDPLAYGGGWYWRLGERLGAYGHSVA